MQRCTGTEQVIAALDGTTAINQFVDGLEFARREAGRQAKLLEAAGGTRRFEFVDLDDAQGSGHVGVRNRDIRKIELRVHLTLVLICVKLPEAADGHNNCQFMVIITL